MFLNLATVLMAEENTHSLSLTPHEVVMISGSQVLLFLPESVLSWLFSTASHVSLRRKGLSPSHVLLQFHSFLHLCSAAF